MAVDADYLYTALLSYNYFPMVKEHRDETPALFSSELFGPDTADMLVNAFNALPKKHDFKKGGFDQIEYRTTRFNNVARRMNIPTPMGYARLCRQLKDTWHEPALNRICSNTRSRIRPEQHEDGRAFRSDDYEDRFSGRVVIMGKDDAASEAQALLRDSMGMFYFVEADISACFPSIYTHALPWALVGHEKAKARPIDHTMWYNCIDKYQRLLKKNETLGVPVGPATSNIACEVVLYPVDEAMREKGFVFTRHIDDYRGYCETREQAEEFLRELERELSKYLLSINAKKVKIEQLPRPLVSPWVLDLRGRLPKTKRVNARGVSDYLDYAVSLNRHEPDGSVVKYATRALSSRLGSSGRELYIQYVLNLAVHVPVVLPVLCEAVKRHDSAIDEDALKLVLSRHIKYRRSDSVGWSLYLYDITGAKMPEDAAKEIVESGDCMSMAAMIAINQNIDRVQDFVNSLDHKDTYCLDRYWILIHELAKRDMLHKDGRFDSYIEDSGLSILSKKSVSFLTIKS